MSEKILYFGYGANSRREMMEAITGNPNLVGHLAALKGFTLCVQRFDQVPEVPQKILKDHWPESFESYTIKPGKESDEVAGAVWELTPLERELVRDWELVELGWYKDMEGKVQTEEGREIKVVTEGLRDGQAIDREVDGKEYVPFLNRLEDLRKVAEHAREEYLARLQTQEGAPLSSGQPSRGVKETV